MITMWCPVCNKVTNMEEENNVFKCSHCGLEIKYIPDDTN